MAFKNRLSRCCCCSRCSSARCGDYSSSMPRSALSLTDDSFLRRRITLYAVVVAYAFLCYLARIFVHAIYVFAYRALVCPTQKINFIVRSEKILRSDCNNRITQIFTRYDTSCLVFDVKFFDTLCTWTYNVDKLHKTHHYLPFTCFTFIQSI